MEGKPGQWNITVLDFRICIKKCFPPRVFTISLSLRQNQDPGRVCRADAGVCLLSAHRAAGDGKLGRGQAAFAGPGRPDCRWEADPAGLPPGLPARRRAHWETHAVRCHLSLPRPGAHHRCQSGLQITIRKTPFATVEICVTSWHHRTAFGLIFVIFFNGEEPT